MRDEWWLKPPLSPTERMRVYGLPVGHAGAILAGPDYDVRAHYARVKALHEAYPYNDPAECTDNTDFALGLVCDNAERRPNAALAARLRTLIDRVFWQEGFYQPLFSHRIDDPPSPTWIVDIVRPSLTRQEAFYTSYADRIEQLCRTLVTFLIVLLDRHAPEAAFADPAPVSLEVRFVELARQGPHLLDCLVASLIFTKTEDEKDYLFKTLSSTLWDNLVAASGYSRDKLARTREPKFVYPSDSGRPLAACAEAYLKDTPFLDLLLMPLPFDIPDAIRCEHTHIVAGSGHGKTQALQHVILGFLERPDPPALIVIDSQGEMLEKIQRLALFAAGGPLADRLIIIDPEDEAAPALNMFDAGNPRLAAYSRLHREQIEAGVIELYNYIFAAIAAEMTGRQSTAFTFVTRLMLSIPGATIHSLRELMEEQVASIEHSAFAPAIARLDATSRAYFQNQFFTKKYNDLRQQIARRLYGVLSVPAFDRMFSPPQNKLDMFDAIQSGKIVLVNTSKALLKSDASALFGRCMIALTLAAVYERVAVKERASAFLICDEAQEYFDEQIEQLLAQARKFNLGVVLAHQHMAQLSPGLRAAVAANTSIKLAGGVSDHDARMLAPDMRSSPDFIASMTKRPRATEFACYVRNLTPQAIRIEVPFGALEAAPRMSDAEHAELRQRNRTRIAACRDEPRPAATSPDAPEPDAATADSDDWRS